MYYLIKWRDNGSILIVKEEYNGYGTVIENNGVETFWQTGRGHYNIFNQPGEDHLFKSEDLEEVKERFMLEIL